MADDSREVEATSQAHEATEEAGSGGLTVTGVVSECQCHWCGEWVEVVVTGDVNQIFLCTYCGEQFEFLE